MNSQRNKSAEFWACHHVDNVELEKLDSPRLRKFRRHFEQAIEENKPETKSFFGKVVKRIKEIVRRMKNGLNMKKKRRKEKIEKKEEEKAEFENMKTQMIEHEKQESIELEAQRKNRVRAVAYEQMVEKVKKESIELEAQRKTRLREAVAYEKMVEKVKKESIELEALRKHRIEEAASYDKIIDRVKNESIELEAQRKINQQLRSADADRKAIEKRNRTRIETEAVDIKINAILSELEKLKNIGGKRMGAERKRAFKWELELEEEQRAKREIKYKNRVIEMEWEKIEREEVENQRRKRVEWLRGAEERWAFDP